MRATFALLLAALALPAFAESPIRLPKLPEPAVPMPALDARLTLTSETLYVIDSDVPLIVLASPAGVVGKTEDAGPIRIKGKFADSPGKFETRMFTGKHVVTIEPVKSGAVELLIVPSGATKEADVIRRMLDVNDGVKPQPPPTPPKPENDAPIKADGFRVLMIYEATTADKPLTGEQIAVMYGAKTRAYLDSMCIKVNGFPQYSIVDKDKDASKLSGAFADAMKRPRQSLPWFIVSNGVTGYEGPITTEADFLEKCKKYEVAK